ncbi:Type 1 glutamine amidotransferase-like domain-containing protein [Mariniluteicoccus flavus]
MRLFLASFRTVDDPERFVRLCGKGRTGLVCANAIDNEDPDVRAQKVRDEIALLKGWGLKATELDLRDEVPMTVAEKLLGAGFVWVRGGNVFVLRRAMGACGLDQLLPQLLARDVFVYAGYSAGPCVLAPDLAPFAVCDDPGEAERLYGAAAAMSGLGVLDRPFVPHLETPDHPESAVLDGVAAAYAAAGQPFWGLADGQALVIDGKRTEAPDGAAR